MAKFVAEYGKDGNPIPEDGRLDSPAFHRNHPAIRDELQRILHGRTGHAVEIGSGTGRHVVEFARAMPDITWWPTDHIQRHLDSAEGWRLHEGLPNIQTPYLLDASAEDWGFGHPGAPPEEGLVAMDCINVFHIAPWEVAVGVMRGAARHLAPDGFLAVYGPFRRDGHITDGNARFDASLRAENPAWGVRDTAELDTCAREYGLCLDRVVDMPSNNFLLIFQGAG